MSTFRLDGARLRVRGVTRPAHGVARAAWLVLGLTTSAAAVALILLHAWIFWDQLASGRLVDPALGLKWVGAGAICAALLLLRRAGVALLWGRKAFVVWLLVALLHVGAGTAASPTGAADPQSNAIAVFVLPALLSSVAALSLGVVLLWRLTRAGSPLGRLLRSCLEPLVVAPSAACLRQIPPRAPPIGFASRL